MDFQVGKKYVLDQPSSVIFECLFVAPDKAGLLINPDGTTHFVQTRYRKFYKEHVEKKRGTVWVNIYPDMFSIWKTRAEADKHAYKSERLACVEVPWEEGQGL